MGRKEKRMINRRSRIEDRKNKILIDPCDISKMKKNIINDTNNYRTEALMTCFALAEHRLYGHGSIRLLRTLKYVDELMGKILSGEYTMEDYIEDLKNETGIEIKC